MLIAHNKLPIIDWEHQVKTETDAPIALAKELLTMFLEQLPELHANLQSAIKQKNLVKLEAILHRMHGACSYCGLVRLRETIIDLTTYIKTAKKVSPKEFAIIDKEIILVVKELKKNGVTLVKAKPTRKTKK